MFRKYDKIHALHKEECAGILIGDVVIQEKIDGANTSIWMEEGWIHGGSRSRDLKGEDFNGFTPFIQQHEGIKKLLLDHPDWILYGEWLVRHTIAYKETAYKKWYMFDIWAPETGYMPIENVVELGKEYGIEMPEFMGSMTNPSLEALKEMVGKTTLGDKGEGIVIKNYSFKNQFGDRVYAKIVTEGFKEDNGVIFGGNNKHSDTYEEMYIVNKYITLTRVKKIMSKLQPEINIRLDMEHIPRICNTVYHDMMTEEAWTIAQNKKKVDFAVLQRIAFKKIKQVFVDILNDNISVADVNG